MRAGILLLAAALLAGCFSDEPETFWEPTDGCEDRPKGAFAGSPDWSKEVLEYRITADQPFRVQLPLVLSERGSQPEDWRPDLGSLDVWERVETSRGPAIEVEHAQGRVVIGCSIQPAQGGNGCCAEGYLDGTWSLGPEGTRPSSIWLHVVEGSVRIEIDYAAESTWCGADASFSSAELGAGWHAIDGAHGAYCA